MHYDYPEAHLCSSFLLLNLCKYDANPPIHFAPPCLPRIEKPFRIDAPICRKWCGCIDSAVLGSAVRSTDLRAIATSSDFRFCPCVRATPSGARTCSPLPFCLPATGTRSGELIRPLSPFSNASGSTARSIDASRRASPGNAHLLDPRGDSTTRLAIGPSSGAAVGCVG